MKVFLTEYKIDGTEMSGGEAKYSSQFFAQNFSHAKDIIKRRGIGESIESMGVLKEFDLFDSDILDDVKSDKLMHLAIHSLWIYAHMYSPKDIVSSMGDRGIIHELIHVRSGAKCVTGEKVLIKKLKMLFNEVFNLPKNFWNHTVNEFDK